MTNCAFGERRARGHITGSSEPDVIIGSDKDRNRGCKKKDKDHIEFLCELYEAQAAQGRYFVHELTSEASSRMKCAVKIMAMPGTRAAVADLCMFGLVACDDQDSSTRACESWGAVAKQMQQHASTCPGRCRRRDRKEGASGNVGARSRQSNRRTTEKGRAGAEDARSRG